MFPHNLIKCTKQDGMSEYDFIASITLLGLVTNKTTKNYYVCIPGENGFTFYGEPITIKSLYITYKQITYPLGEYKRLLYKIIKDLKEHKKN